MTNYLEVKNLSKSFDSFQLHNISFTLPKGYIMGLIGPNGSGKTTTIKLILNVLYRHDHRLHLLGNRKNSMERLYGILPIKKSEMVTGRYLFVLALGAMALVVSLITQPIVLRAMGESVGAFDMISAAIGGLFLFALYTVFQIPGYYKYGAIKGRVFMYIPVAGFLATLFFLPKMPADNPIVTTVVSSPVLLIGLVLVLVVVMYAVSIWFSIRIMENKEM